MICGIAIVLMTVFLSISLVHVYWAVGGRVGQLAAIPERDGKPVFHPSTIMTAVVALILALCAVLIAATGGLLALPLPEPALAWLTRALAVGLLLRAIGDFRLVGFFKRVRDTRFAQLDTVLYSQLCLMLATGCAIVGLAAHA
ncbi:MAG TPA: DUF3995 domain-containing protein [Nitrospira sp.]|nr:DUF3995 domain-containing protein [Nitrospira sp.]